MINGLNLESLNRNSDSNPFLGAEKSEFEIYERNLGLTARIWDLVKRAFGCFGLKSEGALDIVRIGSGFEFPKIWSGKRIYKIKRSSFPPKNLVKQNSGRPLTDSMPKSTLLCENPNKAEISSFQVDIKGARESLENIKKAMRDLGTDYLKINVDCNGYQHYWGSLKSFSNKINSNQIDYLYFLAPYFLSQLEEFFSIIVNNQMSSFYLRIALLSLIRSYPIKDSSNFNIPPDSQNNILLSINSKHENFDKLSSKINEIGTNIRSKSLTKTVEFINFEYEGTTQEKKEAFILKWHYIGIVEVFSEESLLPSWFSDQLKDDFFNQLLMIRSPSLRMRFLNRLPLFLTAWGQISDLDSSKFRYGGVPLLPLYGDLLLCFDNEKAEAIYGSLFENKKILRSLKDKKKQLAFLNLLECLIFSIDCADLKELIIQHVLNDSKSLQESAYKWILILGNQNFDEKIFIEETNPTDLKNQNWDAILENQNKKNLKYILEKIDLPESSTFFSGKQIDVLQALFLKADAHCRYLKFDSNKSLKYQNPIKELVRSIFKNCYREERYKKLLDLSEIEKNAWIEDIREKMDDYVAIETDDPFKMLLATSDVNQACMSIFSFEDGSREGPAYYFINPESRLILIEDCDGNSVARSYVRLNQNRRTLIYELYQSKYGFMHPNRENVNEIFNSILEKKRATLGADWEIAKGVFSP